MKECHLKIFITMSYYRLKQTDFDGKYSYSNIIALRPLKKDELFLVYPNPSNGSFVITVKEFTKEGYGIRITNSLGQLVFSSDNNTEEQLRLSPDLNEGVYTISLVMNNERVNKKMVVQSK